MLKGSWTPDQVRGDGETNGGLRHRLSDSRQYRSGRLADIASFADKRRMSIYRRDEKLPEWEPVPWSSKGLKADEQEAGFHVRAITQIKWSLIPFRKFPEEGVFGFNKEWLIERDDAFFATIGGEDLLLIDNTWFGWPDPPRWGLATRPSGRNELAWSHWGHFADLPQQWKVQPTTD